MMHLDLTEQGREDLRSLLEISRSVLANSIGQISAQLVSGTLPAEQTATVRAERARADELADAARRLLLGLIVNRGSQSAGATPATIVAPLGRSADAASVSVAVSTEDAALITAITTALTAVTGTKAAGTAAASALLAGLVYNSSAPALTTGQQVAAQADVAGNIYTSQQRTPNVAHVMPARITTNAAAPTDLLAAATAVHGLIVSNVHATEPVNIRTDGSDATSVLGHALAAGRGLKYGVGEVPTGKISGYSTNAGSIQIEYW